MSKPLLLLTSDLHFSLNPPVARSAEPDWFAAQSRQWGQIAECANDYRIPVVVAGDVFDRWNSPAHLINFVIGEFCKVDNVVFAIPGQHDLPNHSYGDMHRSAYGTLVAAEALVDLRHTIGGHAFYDDASLWVWAFPWGFDIEPVEEESDAPLKLAVVHKYIWRGSHRFPGASSNCEIDAYRSQLKGYDAAVFGDNHKGFIGKAGRCNVLNCGGFMPRKSDEREYQPHFGLLMDDGTIDRVPLDTSQDKWVDPEDLDGVVEENAITEQLVNELESLGGDSLDFLEMLRRVVNSDEVTEGAKQAILSAIDEGQEGDG